MTGVQTCALPISFMAVGAGHMDDPGGIVSGLRALGYTVELVP